MVDYGHLNSIMKQEPFENEALLLCWSLSKMEALKYVVDILLNKFQFKLTDYAHYVSICRTSPMWKAIREKENGLEKVQLLIPLATKQFWNSGKNARDYNYSFGRGNKLLDHTPLADAIMIGKVDIVMALLPLTKITGYSFSE